MRLTPGRLSLAGAVAAVAMAWGLIAMPSQADAQSRTRLAWPNANTADQRARANSPQQQVAFKLRPITHEAALAKLPAADISRLQGYKVDRISQTVRVHNMLDVTLTRTSTVENGREYTRHCLWIDYDVADIPDDPGQITPSLTIDILWSGRGVSGNGSDTVQIDQARMVKNKASYFPQPACQAYQAEKNDPDTFNIYFTRPFRLFPFRQY